MSGSASGECEAEASLFHETYVEPPSPGPDTDKQSGPPTKRPKKKNAYVVFVHERKKEEEARGNKMPRDLKNLISLFSDEWASMDEYAREPYKAMAREFNNKNGHFTGNEPQFLNQKVTPELLAERFLHNPRFDGGKGQGERNAIGEDWSDRTQAGPSGSQKETRHQQTWGPSPYDDEDWT